MIKKTPSKTTEDKAQKQRFIQAAREAGCSEDEKTFDKNLKRIVLKAPADKKRRKK
jgi:hypothetical protein